MLQKVKDFLKYLISNSDDIVSINNFVLLGLLIFDMAYSWSFHDLPNAFLYFTLVCLVCVLTNSTSNSILTGLTALKSGGDIKDMVAGAITTMIQKGNNSPTTSDINKQSPV